jgi:predicted transcriptional regulator of viral defense system
VTAVHDFIARRSVFRFDEFRAVHAGRGRRSAATTATLLKQWVKAGRIVNLRRGLYATVPSGRRPESLDLNPFVVASRLAPDATVAYRAALDLWGKSVTPSRLVYYLAPRRARPFVFRGLMYVPVMMPPAARGLTDLASGIVIAHRDGLPVRVTSLERTLVDVLDAPRYGGTWTDIWQSLESIPSLDLDFVVLYAIRLGSALTVARVGFYLEQHRDALGVDARYLEALRRNAPRQPIYLDGRRERGRLVAGWNLVVPDRLFVMPANAGTEPVIGSVT